MFWKTKKLDTKSLSDKLENESTELIDILEEPDILQECLVKNTELINFLLQDHIYDSMFLQALNKFEDPEEEKHYKYARLCTEMLTQGVMLITKLFTCDQTIDKFHSFLENKPDDPVLISFYSKIMIKMLAVDSEMTLSTLQHRDKDYAVSLLENVHHSAIIDLIFKFFFKLDSPESTRICHEWVTSQELLPKTIALLNFDSDLLTVSNVSLMVCDILGNFKRESLCELHNKDFPVFDFEIVKIVDSLFTVIFDNPPMEGALVSKDVIVSNAFKVVEQCLEEAKHGIETPRGEAEFKTVMKVFTIVPTINSVARLILKRLPEIVKLLANPQIKSIETTAGLLDPPFGRLRLAVVRLLHNLITIECIEMQTKRDIIAAFIDLKVIDKLWELFRSYPNNTFLHNKALMCFLRCLEVDVEVAVTPEHWTPAPTPAPTEQPPASPVEVARGGGPGCLDSGVGVPPLDLSGLDNPTAAAPHQSQPPDLHCVATARANLVATMASAVDQSYSANTSDSSDPTDSKLPPQPRGGDEEEPAAGAGAGGSEDVDAGQASESSEVKSVDNAEESSVVVEEAKADKPEPATASCDQPAKGVEEVKTSIPDSTTTTTATTTPASTTTTTPTPTTTTTTTSDVKPAGTIIYVSTTNINAPHKKYIKNIETPEADIQFPLLTMFLKDFNMPSKIMEAFEENKNFQTIKKNNRRGYMGQLIMLAVKITNCSDSKDNMLGRKISAIFDTMDQDFRKKWKDFSNNELFQEEILRITALIDFHKDSSFDSDDLADFGLFQFRDDSKMQAMFESFNSIKHTNSFDEKLGIDENEFCPTTNQFKEKEMIDFDTNFKNPGMDHAFSDECSQRLQELDSDKDDLWQTPDNPNDSNSTRMKSMYYSNGSSGSSENSSESSSSEDEDEDNADNSPSAGCFRSTRPANVIKSTPMGNSEDRIVATTFTNGTSSADISSSQSTLPTGFACPPTFTSANETSGECNWANFSTMDSGTWFNDDSPTTTSSTSSTTTTPTTTTSTSITSSTFTAESSNSPVASDSAWPGSIGGADISTSTTTTATNNRSSSSSSSEDDDMDDWPQMSTRKSLEPSVDKPETDSKTDQVQPSDAFSPSPAAYTASDADDTQTSPVPTSTSPATDDLATTGQPSSGQTTATTAAASAVSPVPPAAAETADVEWQDLARERLSSSTPAFASTDSTTTPASTEDNQPAGVSPADVELSINAADDNESSTMVSPSDDSSTMTSISDESSTMVVDSVKDDESSSHQTTAQPSATTTSDDALGSTAKEEAAPELVDFKSEEQDLELEDIDVLSDNFSFLSLGMMGKSSNDKPASSSADSLKSDEEITEEANACLLNSTNTAKDIERKRNEALHALAEYTSMTKK